MRCIKVGALLMGCLLTGLAWGGTAPRTPLGTQTSLEEWTEAFGASSFSSVDPSQKPGLLAQFMQHASPRLRYLFFERTATHAFWRTPAGVRCFPRMIDSSVASTQIEELLTNSQVASNPELISFLGPRLLRDPDYFLGPVMAAANHPVDPRVSELVLRMIREVTKIGAGPVPSVIKSPAWLQSPRFGEIVLALLSQETQSQGLSHWDDQLRFQFRFSEGLDFLSVRRERPRQAWPDVLSQSPAWRQRFAYSWRSHSAIQKTNATELFVLLLTEQGRDPRNQPAILNRLHQLVKESSFSAFDFLSRPLLARNPHFMTYLLDLYDRGTIDSSEAEFLLHERAFAQDASLRARLEERPLDYFRAHVIQRESSRMRQIPPASAEVRARALADFKKFSELNPENVPQESFRELINRQLVTAEAHLKAQGVQTRMLIGEGDLRTLLIVPCEGAACSHPLNRHAAEVYRKMGVQIQFDPESLVSGEEHVLGSFGGDNVVRTSRRMIELCDVLEQTHQHEIGHATQSWLVREGHVQPHSGRVSALEGSPLLTSGQMSPTYGQGMSFDEMNQHFADIRRLSLEAQDLYRTVASRKRYTQAQVKRLAEIAQAIQWKILRGRHLAETTQMEAAEVHSQLTENRVHILPSISSGKSISAQDAKVEYQYETSEFRGGELVTVVSKRSLTVHVPGNLQGEERNAEVLRQLVRLRQSGENHLSAWDLLVKQIPSIFETSNQMSASAYLAKIHVLAAAIPTEGPAQFEPIHEAELERNFLRAVKAESERYASDPDAQERLESLTYSARVELGKDVPAVKLDAVPPLGFFECFRENVRQRIPAAFRPQPYRRPVAMPPRRAG